MASIYRCDRCQKTFDSPRGTISGSVIRGTLRVGWYPTNVDLCFECRDSLQDLLGNWWKMVDNKPHITYTYVGKPND